MTRSGSKCLRKAIKERNEENEKGKTKELEKKASAFRVDQSRDIHPLSEVLPAFREDEIAEFWG